MTDVLSDLHTHSLSVQQDFNLLDEKLNDPKTDDKSSITERMELLEADNHTLKILSNTLEMTVDANVHEYFYDANRALLQQLKFQVTDPRGSFTRLEHELT